MSMKARIFIGFAIILIGSIIVAIMFLLKSPPPKISEQPTSPLVKVLQPKVQAVTFNLETHGVVNPHTQTILTSEVSGRIEQVSEKFIAGSLLQKNEIILQIDSSEYDVAIEQAKARLAGQQAKYAQEKAQSEQAIKEWELTGKPINKAPALALRKPFLQEAKANVESAMADLKQAEQKLERTIIRAPYTAMVKTKQIGLGQYVSLGTQLGEIFAIDYAEVRLPLTDNDLAFINPPSIKTSSESLIDASLIANYSGKSHQWPAKLVRMEAIVDEQSRVHYAIARVADPYAILNSNQHQSPPLKIGTFVKARINGKSQENVVALPRSAFRNMSEILICDENNQLKVKSLQVLRFESGQAYVKPSFKPGEKVILTKIESPIEGMSLRIENTQEPPDSLPSAQSPE